MSEAAGAGWRVGAVLEGRYELIAELGRGGMGVVHRIRHLDWHTDLAVKSPLPALFQAERLRAQFVTEAETWVSLGLHPHVCTCHCVRTVDGVPRVFAEFVSGGSLLEWVAGPGRRLYAGGPLESLTRVLDVAIQVAWGLEHAHQQGVVHRDVKPANVLMDADGTAKLTDFGLAKVKDLTRQESADAAPGTSLLGPGGGGLTPAYASPEQASGRPVGRRSDVYSYAVLVLELFAGGVSWLTGSAAGEALGLLRSGPSVDPALPPLYYGTVRISSDLRFVAWALDGKAELWDEVHGHQELYDAGSGHGAALDMTPDGNRVVFAVEGVLRVWAPGTDRSWVSAPAPGGMGPGVVQLSRDAQFAVTSGYVNGRIHVWDLLLTRRGRLLEGHRGGAWALSVSDYGRHVLSAGSDGTLRYWDARDGRCLPTFSGFDGAGFVAASRFDRHREHGNGDSAHLPDDAGRAALHALTISHDGEVRHWALPAAADPAANGVTPRAQPWLSRPRPHTELTKLATRADELLAEARSALADGRFAQAHDLLGRARAIEGHERDPRLLDAWRELARHTTRTGLRATWPGRVLAEGQIQAADLSADGRTTAVAHLDGTVIVQDTDEGITLRSFRVQPRGNNPVLLSLSHDGTHPLTTEQNRILLWSVRSGECRSYVLGRFALTAGRDFRVRIWDVSTGACLGLVGGHLHPIDDIVVTADARRMLSWSMIDGARLWELDWDLAATPGQ